MTDKPVHYGSGMRAAICGERGDRRETTHAGRVTCKECKKIVKGRPQ